MIKRVALHCESIAGGGHMPVIANLARALCAQNFEVFLLTSEQSYKRGAERNYGTTQFAFLPDFIRNPETGRATLTPDGEEYSTSPAYQRVRGEAILEQLEKIQPDAIITDSWPLGKGHFDRELLPALDKYHHNTRIYALARDVMFYKHEGRDGLDNDQEAARLINAYYDGVFITGDERLFRFDESFTAAENIHKPIHYAGYFAANMPKRTMMLNSDRKVLVSLGGGFTEKSSLPVYMSAIEARKDSPLAKYGWKVFVSHDCDDALFEQIKAKAAEEAPDGRIEVTRNTPDYRSELANAAGVICQAGLNTAIEIVQTCRMADIPVLMCPIIPANGMEVTGQTYRAELLQKHGLAQVIDHDDFSNPQAFVDAIERANDKTRPRTIPDIRLGGPEYIARRIAQETNFPKMSYTHHGTYYGFDM